MGWKDWVYGDLVSAADFQSLVQDQTVQRYADSAARTSALGSAVAEGMVSYLDSTNQVEVYDGSSWAGLGSGSSNVINNGNFDIWQRGTSKTIGAFDAQFLADRWGHFSGTGCTASRETSTLPEGSLYGLKVTGGATSGGYGIHQAMETINAITLANKTVTFTVQATGTTGKTPFLGISYSTNVDQTWATGWTTVADGSKVTMTSGTFKTLTVTATIPSNAKSVRWNLYTDTLASTEFIIFAQAQAELGSSATPFKRNAPSIAAELETCKRYAEVFGGGLLARATSSSQIVIAKNPKVQKRASASTAIFDTASVLKMPAGTAQTGITLTIASGNGNSSGGWITLNCSPSLSGVSAGDWIFFYSDSFLDTAEL